MENKIEELNLETFNPTVAELRNLVEKTRQIIVTNIHDRELIEDVKENRIILRDARIAIRNRGKELRDSAIKFQKAVIAREKELIKIIQPEEDRLQAIEDDAKNYKIREQRTLLLPKRKETLNAIGDGNDYSKEDELLLGMDDTQFQTFVNERTVKKNEKDAFELKKREDEIREQELALQREKEMREHEEKAREEERLRAIQREEERVREEELDKLKKEADEREKQLKLEKEKRYQEFLKENGYDEATKELFHIERNDKDKKVTLYKVVGVFSIGE